MSTSPAISIAEAHGHAVRRGVVRRVEDEHTVLVDCEGAAAPCVCDVLQTSQLGGLRLAPRDAVLVWVGADGDRHGVVLGRIGLSHAPPPNEPDVPEELVLEARESLTLRVGDGSITLRADGKILIKGKDLVSHAERMNRIKGGAVSIN